MIVSTTELSNILGLSQRHIYTLEKGGILHKNDKDSWDIYKNIQSYMLYKIELETSDTDSTKAKIRREIADAKLKEIQYKEKSNQLISLEAIAKDLEDIAVTISNKLYNLPYMLKRSFELSPELLNALNKEIDSILNELKDPEIYIQKANELKESMQKEQVLQDLQNI